MWFPLPDPILADGGWVSVVFLVVMFLGWIMNLLSKQKKLPLPVRGRRRQPLRRAGDDQLQSEIDNFLQEVGGGRPRERVEEVAIEIVADEDRSPRRKRRPQQRPQSLPSEQPPTPMKSTPVESKSGRLSERHMKSSIGSQRLGSGLREHVADHMADDHIDDLVEQDLDHSVGSDWATHGERLGTGAGDVEFAQPAGETTLAQVTSQEIVNLLRNPATIRQAIIISEILSPPKSRR